MNEEKEWTYVIKPVEHWYRFKLDEVWKQRELLWMFVKRNFITVYKQTLLGPLWLLFVPILTTMVFTVVFGKIARMSTNGSPQFLFYMLGNITWTLFANCVNKTSSTFTGNAHIFGKVYFPRLVIPISTLITNLIQFAIQFLLFLCFALYYHESIKLGIWSLFMPILLLHITLLGLGIGLIFSAITVKYRDLSVLVSFIVQLWLYATPVVYPASSIPQNYYSVFMCNPLAPILESMRYLWFGTGSISPKYLALSAITTVIMLLVGLILFTKVERNFMDVV